MPWTETRWLVAFVGLSLLAMAQDRPVFEASAEERFAKLALECVGKEYPNKISHTMQRDEDARPPRKLTPAFYGCFDWHSAVHGHWLLARLAKLHPRASFANEARAALGRSLTPENIAGEVAYLTDVDREGFERPYGLAWLLQLALELGDWPEEEPRLWSKTLQPLEDIAAERLLAYFARLGLPARVGEHSQTAFALGLTLDWAKARRPAALAALSDQAKKFYLADFGWRLAFEPSGQDFLSPGLAEADVMRRVLAPAEFSAWLTRFLPEIPTESRPGWWPVGVPADRKDGKFAHLDGLNLARAWMLEGVLAGLPESDGRRPALMESFREHRDAGLAAVTGEHYAGGHWLGTFAVYLVTRRGLSN